MYQIQFGIFYLKSVKATRLEYIVQNGLHSNLSNTGNTTAYYYLLVIPSRYRYIIFISLINNMSVRVRYELCTNIIYRFY